ncbi:NlpC/P60 family protein, partial [Gordonibacter sp.]|uniref:NlpC/P60 family protein n=1 Tax=Gordonibacter sp. TaxID=1968902 RepID=UPI002FCB7D1F
GFVVRGKYVAADGSVYLADNGGRLERAGWIVTDSYDGGMQRYWVDSSTHAATTGFFEADGSSYYGLPGDGRELRGAASVGGEFVFADNDGRLLERGWVVTDSFGQGLQRYWFEGFRAARSLLADVGSGQWAYARPEGFVVRGKYVAADGSVYLADNDGRLKRAGWVVTDAYDGGMQRYWVDSSTHAATTGFFVADGSSYYGIAGQGFVMRGAYSYNDSWVLLADNDGRLASGEGWLVSGSYTGSLERYWLNKMENGRTAARVGFFTASDGKVYYAHTSLGSIARGKTPYGSGILLSDNEGVLVENVAGEGWLVTGVYDRGALQRYRIDKSCDGHLGAHVGMFSLDSNFYYGMPSVGYVLRNTMSVVDGRWWSADNEGVLTVVGNRVVRLTDGTYQWIDGSGRVNQDEAISRLMNAANSVLGVPYVWLGNYPEDGGMDCASFTYWCYKQIGIAIDFETYGQIYEGRPVSLSEARPGDLILMYFSSPGVPEHVVLYAGNGMVYEEPDFGGHCQYVPLSSKNASYVVVRRMLA